MTGPAARTLAAGQLAQIWIGGPGFARPELLFQTGTVLIEGATPLRRYPVVGGQGTLNVNSWSPDGTRFAFVAYPFT